MSSSDKVKLANAMFGNVERKFIPNPEDLKIIMEQSGCSEEEANTFFNKNKGDLEATIFDYLVSSDVLKKDVKKNMISTDDLLNENISLEHKMDTYREILYQKDKVFQANFDETSDLMRKTVNNFDYIAFKSSTKEHRKLKFKGSKELFSMEIIRPYVEGEISDQDLYEISQKKYRYNSAKGGIELENDVKISIEKPDEKEKEEEDKPKQKALGWTEKEETKNEENAIETTLIPEKKIILKTIVKKGLSMAKKWGCNKPVLAYIEVDEKEQTEENINKLATKFMVNSGHFSETQKIYGPAIIIDNWIL
jgi:hypothetical protein